MLLSDQIYKTLHKGCHPLSAVVDDLAEINLRCNADVQLDQSVALYITPDRIFGKESQPLTVF